MSVIEEIYDKMHKFGADSPRQLFINYEHYCEIMEVKNFMQYVQIDFSTGKPETILGMQYQIKDDLAEMEVH